IKSPSKQLLDLIYTRQGSNLQPYDLKSQCSNGAMVSEGRRNTDFVSVMFHSLSTRAAAFFGLKERSCCASNSWARAVVLLDAAALAPDNRFKNVGLAIQRALDEITEFKLTEATKSSMITE